MEANWISLLLWPSLVLILLLLLFRRNNKKSASNKRLPPGPPGWPLFGHLFSLGTLPHATMAGLRDKYGPVIWLKLGSVNTMVVLTANAAAELFKNHDLSFADRIVVETMTSHDYHKNSMAFAPHGPYWRVLRRLYTAELLSSNKINQTAPVRRKCIDEMLSWIEKESGGDEKNRRGIEISRFIFLAVFNVFGNSVFSRDLVEPGSEVGAEFFTGLTGFVRWNAHPNVSDLFGFLKRFDLQGLKRKMDRDMGKALKIVSRYIKERLEEKGEIKRNDLLDLLLAFQGTASDDEPLKLSQHNISHLIMEIFIGGVESTSHTVEWALAELLRNPEKMIEAKSEILKVVGRNRRFEERDIDNVPYLQAVVKETLRLHPPAPLIPKRANKDTEFMGYLIPKGTHVMINAWAISRDPERWDDPLCFEPERFLKEPGNIDFRGKHFEYIPFGAGRRICVGLPLAHRLLHLTLGSLLHEFSWELEGSITTIDMTEKMGMAVRKSVPLRIIPKKYMD